MGIFESYDNVLRWMPQNLTDDKSTLVQVWLGGIRQQAICWVNVDPDLCRHMASLGVNDLTPPERGNLYHRFLNEGNNQDDSNS